MSPIHEVTQLPVCTWMGLYRDMSYQTIERVHFRCYGRIFDDWDRDSWNDGHVVAQCDVQPYCLRGSLISQPSSNGLGSNREWPLQELAPSLSTFASVSFRSSLFEFLNHVRACLDCCAIASSICARATTKCLSPQARDGINWSLNDQIC